MTDTAMLDSAAALTAPDTLTIERLLPGPAERVWAWLTDSDLRRQWLASGEMELREGAPFELVWRNDELTDPPGARPPGFEEGAQRMQSRILAADPPRRLAFAWGAEGEVEIVLEPRGTEVLLTLTHRRIVERPARVMIAAGWHAHLDVLAARLGDRPPAPFWDAWTALREVYDRRLPG